MNKFVYFRVETKIGEEAGSKAEYTVYRRFNDFIKLHEKLVHTYSNTCTIVPPPPEKNSMTTVRTKLTGKTDSDGLAKYIG